MKIVNVVIWLLIASIFLIGFASAAEGDPGTIPQIGNISSPATNTDITSDLGVFAALANFILDYAIQIAIFIMVIAAVVLHARGSWSRSRNKTEEASKVQTNQQGLLVDGFYLMAVLLFIYLVLAPFVRSFVQ